MDKIPSLHALRVFDVAVRCGSFALAAAQLRLTPSAVSHQIKALEQEVGQTLFHRHHRRVEPTTAGRRYHGEVESAFRRIAHATAQLRADTRELLAVHSAPSIATLWLMPRLSHFLSEHPDIDVRVSASAEVIDLTDSPFDVSIQYGTRPGGPLQAFTLMGERVTPLASPALLRGPAPLEAVEDLRHHLLIHSDNCMVQWPDWLAQHPSGPLDLGRGPHFDRSHMSISVAIEGLGVCLDSTLLAQRDLAAGRLVAPFAERFIAVAGHHVVVHRSKADLPKIQSFLAWMDRQTAAPAA